MAQIVVEKKKNPVAKWIENHKEPIEAVALGAGLVLGGYLLGKTTENIYGSMGMEMARGDGFLKMIDPSTGKECDSITWRKLIKEHYSL